jgi:hypothetical protein
LIICQRCENVWKKELGPPLDDFDDIIVKADKLNTEILCRAKRL